MSPDAATDPTVTSKPQLDQLTQFSSQLGYEIVDIAGFLDMTDQKPQNQLSALTDLTQDANRLISANGDVLDNIEAVSAATEETL